MRLTVLDASALLRFLDAEPGADRVEQLLLQCAAGQVILLMAAVNWGECISALVRHNGMDAANEVIDRLSSLRLTIEPCGAHEAEETAFLKEKFKIPYADAFAAALAKNEDALLVTADYDFKKLPQGLIKIDFLPVKTKKSHSPHK